MALSLTADDSSPLITYSPAGAWVDTPDDDELRGSYAEGSFHKTTTQGATATVQFSGTDVVVVGAIRPGYGTYTLTVDGEERTKGTVKGGPLFKRKLGEVNGLSNGPHTLVITSNGAGLDIDSIVFTTSVGELGVRVPQTLVDDSDPNIVYGPSPSAWQRTSDSPSRHFGGTVSASSDPNASASLNFMGEVVAIYGTTNANHADVEVTLDGQRTIVKGGSEGFARSEHTKNLMFYAQGLDASKPHNLLIKSQPQGDATSVALDGIAVFGTGAASLLPPPPGQQQSNGGSTPTSGKSKAAIIGGSVAGGIAFLLLIALGAFHLWRRRKKRQRPESMPPVTPIDHLPMQRPDMSLIEAGLGVSRRMGPWTPPPKGSFDHSRSESRSSTPVSVIRLGVPQPPMSRKSSMTTIDAPYRPATRPPSLDLPSSI